jgi:hypothetical protein
MADFTKLDPEIRAYALVGQFLKQWSDLEQKIHEAIGTALGLDETRRYILCANLHLKDKINVLRTLVHQSSFESHIKETTVDELTAIQNYSYRNMIAHNAFEPDPNGDGVVFLPVKARSKFSRPRERWPIKRFEQEAINIADFTANITTLQGRFLGPTTFTPNFGWFEGMQETPLPMRRIMSPALHDHQNHFVPMPPNSDPPNQEKHDQTPDEPPEKS